MAKKDDGAGQGGDAHEKARQLAEGALEKYADGRDKEGDKLLERAKEIDASAAVEVAQELQEDSGADPKAGVKADKASQGRERA